MEPTRIEHITSHGLIEIKGQGVRFIGKYSKGRLFIVAHGVEKKKRRLSPQVFEIAKRILRENEERVRR